MQHPQPNPEGDMRLKDAFKKLIERIGTRKLTQRKHINFRTTNKSAELDRYKKYSAGFRDRPRDLSIRRPPTANTTTTLHSMNCLFNHTHASQSGSRLLYTPISGRIRTESFSSGLVIEHKLKEYSELLIAKSYVFSKPPHKPIQLPRSAKASIVTSNKPAKEGVRYFRNTRKQTQKDKSKHNSSVQMPLSIKR